MNFEVAEDSRMLADTLGRFVKQQYGFATRDRIAKSAQGAAPRCGQTLQRLIGLPRLSMHGSGIRGRTT